MFLFSEAQLADGQRVTITMHGPRTFYIRGRVVLCKALSLQKNIVGSKQFPFRVGVPDRDP